MLQEFIYTIKKNNIWAVTYLVLNVLFGFMLFLLNSQIFLHLLFAMFLGSLLLFSGICFGLTQKNVKRKRFLEELIEEPTKIEWMDLSLFCREEQKMLIVLSDVLLAKEKKLLEQAENKISYEEYVESFAHECKTPLALITLILDNRKEEMSSLVYQRFSYIKMKLQEEVDRMLYYARIDFDSKDYVFDTYNLADVCREVLQDYQDIMEESKIHLILNLKDVNVYTDKKGLRFCITQALSNALKYQKKMEKQSYYFRL